MVSYSTPKFFTTQSSPANLLKHCAAVPLLSAIWETSPEVLWYNLQDFTCRPSDPKLEGLKGKAKSQAAIRKPCLAVEREMDPYNPHHKSKSAAKSLKNKVETLHYKLQTLFGMIFHQAKQASRPKITAELFCSPYKNLETLKVSHFAEARSKSRITMVTLAPSSVWLLQQVAFKEHRSSHLRCHQTTFRQTSTNSEVRLAGDHTLEIWFDGPVRSNLKMFHTKRAYPNCTVSHVSLQTILELYVLIKEWEPSTSSRKCECKKRHFQTWYGLLTNWTSIYI